MWGVGRRNISQVKSMTPGTSERTKGVHVCACVMGIVKVTLNWLFGHN